MDQRTAVGEEFVLSLSVYPGCQGSGEQTCLHVQPAGQMVQAIKRTDKTETNNRLGENCTRPPGRMRQIWAGDWPVHSGQTLFALIRRVTGSPGSLRVLTRQLLRSELICSEWHGTFQLSPFKDKKRSRSTRTELAGIFLPRALRPGSVRACVSECQEFIFNHLFSDLFWFDDNYSFML